MRYLISCAFILCLPIASLSAQVSLGPRTTSVLAGIDEAKEVLCRNDDFTQRQSPFDRSARLKTDQPVSEEKYFAFISDQISEWDAAQQDRITAACKRVAERISKWKLPMPEKILLIRTTGKEEGNAAYTRANAIVLPPKITGGRDEGLDRLLCHELFHVISRHSPNLREKLYKTIGFEKCDEIKLPEDLQKRRLTNPDAPCNDHCIRVKVDGRSVWAVPILFTESEQYDLKRGGEFFNYLVFKLMVIDREEGSTKAIPHLIDGKPELVSPNQAEGFMEQIGRNTGYIIHPEEVLADNFAMLAMGNEKEAKSPELLAKIREALETN